MNWLTRLFGGLSHAEACRRQHLKGRNCCECGITVTPNGGIYRRTRDLIWYCKYDIPERAGKQRDRGLACLRPQTGAGDASDKTA